MTGEEVFNMYVKGDRAYTALLYLEKNFIIRIEDYFKKLVDDVDIVCKTLIMRNDDFVTIHIELNKDVNIFYIVSVDGKIKNVDVYVAHEIAAKYDMLHRSKRIKDAVHIYDTVINKPCMIGDILGMYKEYAESYDRYAKEYKEYYGKLINNECRL